MVKTAKNTTTNAAKTNKAKTKRKPVKKSQNELHSEIYLPIHDDPNIKNAPKGMLKGKIDKVKINQNITVVIDKSEDLLERLKSEKKKCDENPDFMKNEAKLIRQQIAEIFVTHKRKGLLELKPNTPFKTKMERIFNIRDEKCDEEQHKKWLEYYGEGLAIKSSDTQNQQNFEQVGTKSELSQSTNIPDDQSDTTSVFSMISDQPVNDQIDKNNGGKAQKVNFSAKAQTDLTSEIINVRRQKQAATIGKKSEITPIQEESDEENEGASNDKEFRPANHVKIVEKSSFVTKYNLRSKNNDRNVYKMK